MPPRARIDNETQCLAMLRDYGILDTGSDEALDAIVELVADICGTPIALVSLVDETRQWFKAKVGLRVDETPRDVAFCAHAIESSDSIFSVEDARVDPRFENNPLVTDDPNVVFYAGAPLKVAEGAVLGTLCVIDRKPRVLSEAQRAGLLRLSRVVVRHLELRRAASDRDAANAFNRTVLGSIGDAVIAADSQGCVTYMNTVAETLTGWSLTDARSRVMRDVFQIINEETRNIVESPVDRVLREGIVVGLANPTLLIRKDGTEVAIEDSAAPIRSETTGVMSGVVLVFRDASIVRDLERQRVATLSAVQNSERVATAEQLRLFRALMHARLGSRCSKAPSIASRSRMRHIARWLAAM